jgi:acetolactate synthase-1/2/3 large subunit
MKARNRFGVPGEENVDIMDALLGSPIKFITTRHEQGGAFMARSVRQAHLQSRRLPVHSWAGATNLITGVADADMDRAPVVAIAGQGATTQGESQILDLVR